MKQKTKVNQRGNNAAKNRLFEKTKKIETCWIHQGKVQSQSSTWNEKMDVTTCFRNDHLYANIVESLDQMVTSQKNVGHIGSRRNRKLNSLKI